MRKFALDKNISDAKAELIILRNYCKLVGIDLHIDDCVICHNHHIKTVFFQRHGLICGKCFNEIKCNMFSLEFSKLVYFLFKDNYEQMDKYEECYCSLLIHLKQYIFDNNGTYFNKIKK